MKGRVVQQKKRKCPYCSSTELEYRKEGTICLNCGGILEERNVVSEEGRRFFSREEWSRKKRTSFIPSYRNKKHQEEKIRKIADIVGAIARKFDYGQVKARRIRGEVKNRFGKYLRSKKIRRKDPIAGALFRILTWEPLAEIARKIKKVDLPYRSFAGESEVTKSELRHKVKEIERYIKKEKGKERAYQRIKKRIENNQLPVFFSTGTLEKTVKKEGVSLGGRGTYFRKKLEQDGYRVRREGSDWIISEKSETEDLERSEGEVEPKLLKPKEKLEGIIRES